MGAAWRERNGWETNVISLGKYLTEADASLAAIGMMMEHLLPILSKALSMLMTDQIPSRTPKTSTRSGPSLEITIRAPTNVSS